MGNIVLFGRCRPLQSTEGHVVVREEQPIAADELARSAAEPDDGAHETSAVGFIEVGRIHLQAQGLEIQIHHLVRHPHAFLGSYLDGQAAEQQAGN